VRLPCPKWDDLKGNEDAVNLLAYLRKNNYRQSNVNTLKQNWGRKNDFNSREDIRSILSELVAAAIAEWTDNDKLGFRVLPNWEDFPSWLD